MQVYTAEDVGVKKVDLRKEEFAGRFQRHGQRNDWLRNTEIWEGAFGYRGRDRNAVSYQYYP